MPKRHSTAKQRVEFGLSTIPKAKKIRVSLRDLVYVHQVLAEYLQFFYQPLPPARKDIERFLGNPSSGGGLEVLHTALSRKMGAMFRKEILNELAESVRFQHPLPPDYYDKKGSVLPTPPTVARLADAFVALMRRRRAKSRESRRVDFCCSFFTGFTSCDAMASGGTEAWRRGYLAGQKFRRANPTRIKETMEGFGYTAIEADGTWTDSFEHSDFTPDMQPTQTWWLAYFGNTRSGLSNNVRVLAESFHPGVPVRVRGYLSPFGRHGHCGYYPHEILATAISTIGGEPEEEM